MDRQFVHVCQDTLDLLLLVDLNVSQAMNVHKTRLATIRNASTLAQELAELMQNVKSEITIQSAVVLHATQATRSLDVKLKLFNSLRRLTLVNLHPVDLTLNVVLLVIKPHALACPK